MFKTKPAPKSESTKGKEADADIVPTLPSTRERIDHEEIHPAEAIEAHKVVRDQTQYDVLLQDGEHHWCLWSDLSPDLLADYNGDVLSILSTKERKKEGTFYQVVFENHPKPRWEPVGYLLSLMDQENISELMESSNKPQPTKRRKKPTKETKKRPKLSNQ